MELTVENLRKVKSFSDKYEGFYRLTFTFFELMEFFFGKALWNWEKVVFSVEKDIRIIDISTTLQQVEKELIINALELTQYNQHEAAKLLNINQVTINRRIKKYKITNNNWKKNKEVKYDGSI